MKLLHRGYLASVALAVVILPMMVLGAEATEGIQYPLYHQLTFSCRLDTVKVSNEYLASISSKGETTFKEEAGLGDIQELLKKLMPGDKVRVTHSIWPRNPGNVLTSGEEHELLMLLRNEWHQNITIFSVSPSFRNPDNMDQITANRIFVQVPAGGEVTLSYRIRPEMDPVSVGLNLVVDYTDLEKQRWFRTQGFHAVIHIVESESKLDARTIIMYSVIMALGIAAIPLLQKAFLSGYRPMGAKP